MKRPFLKKLDILIIVLLLAAAGFGLLPGGTSPGTGVKITKSGDLIGIYPLSQDTLIVIDEHNSVKIDDGKAWMEYADCPDGFCLKMGKIARGSVICLPNRVVVEIIAADTPDAITG